MDYHFGVWRKSLPKEVIITQDAPKALGIYSQGIRANNFIYTSGQIGIDPKTGKMNQSDILIEIRQVIENVKAVLEQGGGSLDTIIKLTVFLTDLAYFQDVNNIFKEYFIDNPPARSAVEVSALPMGARIEIEAVCMLK